MLPVLNGRFRQMNMLSQFPALHILLTLV
jgi:hypothetical protein